jgi:hypothetical protein
MQVKQYYDYDIYSDGTILRNNKPLTLREHNNRYEVKLSIEGKKKYIILSRLLYWLFIEQFDYDNKNLCVSYKDGNGLNIDINNLYLTERKNLIQGEGHKHIIKITDEQIEEIKQAYKGNKINSNQYTKEGISLNDLAKKYGVTKKEIHHIIKGTARNPENYKLK